MKRKIIIALLILILFFGGFVVYLNKVLLPVKLKGVLLQGIETALNRSAQLDSLQYNIFKGIEIKGLTIFESPAYKGGPFLKIKEINFNFLFLPLFKEKKIIITSLKIDSPQLNLIRDKDNLWNCSDLLNIKLSVANLKQRFSFLIYKIRVLKAKCLFEDRTLEPVFLKELQDFNCRLNFAFPAKLKFIFEGKIPGKDLTSQLKAKGELDLTDLQTSGNLTIRDIVANDYQPYYSKLPFSLKSGIIKNAAVKFGWQDEKLSIFSQIETDKIEILRDAYDLKGSPFINAKINYAPAAIENLSYSIDVLPNGLSIEGIAYLKSLEKINGTINIAPDKIQFSSIEGITSGIPIKISGSINDFTNPSINLNLNSDVEISRLKEIFKEQLKGISVDIKGKTILGFEISGLLNEISNLYYRGKASFSNLLAETPILPENIKNISGQIIFDNNGLKWNELKAEYSGEKYVSNGSLNNFLSPSIEADLKSRIIYLSTKFNINRDILSLEALNGKFANSTFKLSGQADISEKENPVCDLVVGLDADLKDLKEVLPKLKESLEKIKPVGLIKIAGNFKGQLKNKESWQTKLNGESSQVSIMGLKMSNLLLNYAKAETPGDNLSILANSYAGTLNISGKIYPSENQIPFNLKGKIDNLDLAQLKLDTPFKDKTTSGTLSGDIALSGLAQNQGSWQGRSSLQFKDGNLWELNLLKGLGKFLLIPELNNIVINEATGNFSIANKNIYIENTELKSSQMIINAEGTIDFLGNLNLRFLTQFSEALIASSDSLKKFITSVLTQASQALTIKVTGTLSQPKYSAMPNVTDIFQNLKGIILNNILK